MVRHYHHRGGRRARGHIFKKKSSCKRGKRKGYTCAKVKGGWKRRRHK